MVADSAISIFGKPKQKTEEARKLFSIQQNDLMVGISAWGYFGIPFPSRQGTDTWLTEWLEKQKFSNNSVKDVAHKLSDDLNDVFQGSLFRFRSKVEHLDSLRLGFHVTGFEDLGVEALPSVYHVHNGHYRVVHQKVNITQAGFTWQTKLFPEEPDFPIKEFQPYPDCVALPKQKYFRLTNGDFGFSSWLDDNDNLSWINEESQKLDTSLEDRGKLLRTFLWTLICKASQKKLGHIDTPIREVLISENTISEKCY